MLSTPRRHFPRPPTPLLLTLSLLALSTGCSWNNADTTGRTPSPSAAPAPAAEPSTDQVFGDLEHRAGARLGVYAIDTGSGRQVSFRADERFAYASTVKALAVAALLKQTSTRDLDRPVDYTAADLVTYSPVTQPRAGTSMTVRELADAALRYSDNTAANLLLRELGGPAGLDAALSRFGDDVIQVARDETGLNEAVPRDPRDTSTPRAMAETLRRVAVDDALSPQDRDLLNGWMRANTTGANLIRAGVPTEWQVGDKTGSGGYGTRNDIAVIWPPERAPLVLTVMTTHDNPDAQSDDALVAAATRVVADALR
jgi:beta-lactamase class A